ncbi:SixA phosphatase family protein [Alloscardovia criceti]|uniref:SixA phosphatase family protein n=1 Tax=Alloscardovia criceti TaxID=356828 RepID=UPI00036B8853|nr:histidine phosphatase family protein [Alloscardovia criceti]
MSINLTKISKVAHDYEYLLILMRHAKTEKSAQDDASRELTDKGKKQAKHVAKAMDGMGLVPDIVAVSGAKRARETADRMLKVFGDKPELIYHKQLYTDGMAEVSEILASQKKKNKTLMIIGHEPSISEAAQWWARSTGDFSHIYETLQLGLSPAAFVILASHKPFEQWDLHEADSIAVISAKDCD